MKNNNTNPSAENLYANYRDTRDVRPSADLDPMLTAANDAQSPRSNVAAPALESLQSWEESNDAKEVSLLYRQWKSSRVTPGELADIRERVISETLAIARVSSQAAANTTPRNVQGEVTLSDKVAGFFRNRIFRPGFASAAVAAVIAAMVFVLAPLDNNQAVDETSLASVSVLDSDLLGQSGDSVSWVSSGIDSSFGFSKSTTRQGRAFGLGVSSMDLVMALRSGSADKTLEVTRHLVGLSQSRDLGNVKTSATAVFDEISLRPEVSRVVFSRAMHLLTEMKNAFVDDDERSLFELGQWVEAVYLLSSSGIESGDTATLRQTLASAKERLASGARISGLNELASSSLMSLSGINENDGVVLAEARLARDLSVRIKSLIE